jgi:hypothetical protein
VVGKTHEMDPEGIVIKMNPAHSHEFYFRKIHLNTPVLQKQEFDFMEHLHIAFFVGRSFVVVFNVHCAVWL